MSSDSPLQTTLDRILSGLRGQLEAGLRAYSEEAQRASAQEHARVVEQATEEVRRQAQDQLAQLRDAAARQNDELRRSAEGQITELRRLLDDLRRNAQQQIESARNTIETEVAAARAQANAETIEAKRAAQAQVEQLQRSTDARLAALSAELDAARDDRDRARQEITALREQLAELATLRQQLADAQERAAKTERTAGPLADAIRSLDESATLADTLDRLVDRAMAHCDRAALLLLRDDRLREWRAAGFPPRQPVAEGMSADDAGIAGTAAREARVLTRAGRDGGPLPVFATSPAPHDASAFPVMVAGTVVAVLYADLTGETTPRGPWTADLEVLARHAGRVLEAITVQQATGLRPVGPVARASQPASPASAKRSADRFPGGVS